MFESIERHTAIGVWIAALVAIAGVGALSGVSITVGASMLWLVACVVPPAVTLMVWRGAPPPTVAEILHCRRSARLIVHRSNHTNQRHHMSRLNGDRARFHKNRRSKLRRRQRVRAMLTALHAPAGEQGCAQALSAKKPSAVKTRDRSERR